jgi:hypothetical protein
MTNLSKNHTGFAVAKIFALAHLIWAILIATMPGTMQSCINWIFRIHGIEPVWKIIPITWIDGILLVIITFIMGYIIGWVFAAIWNRTAKYKMCR